MYLKESNTVVIKIGSCTFFTKFFPPLGIVVVPAFEGEIGILKDHIPLISFLKPGIIKVFIGAEVENYYVEDGIVEFKDNSLSILTSSIFNLKDIDKNHINNSISEAENELSKDEIDDQKRFILNHKVEVLMLVL